MARRPEVRYAWNGDVALAYQVFGAGPVDLVYLQGYVSHVDLNWESPHLARFLRGLGEKARVIHTDRRGWGCSDRFSPGDVAPLEVQVDDLVAVMDAAGSERAVIFTSMRHLPDGGPVRRDVPGADGRASCSSTRSSPSTTPRRRAGVGRDQRPRAPGVGNARLRGGGLARRARAGGLVRARGAARACAPGALAAESDAFGAVDVRAVLSVDPRPDARRRRPRSDDGRSQREQLPRIAQAAIPGSRLIEPTREGGAAWHHWYARGPAILAAVGDLIASIREEQASFDRVLATVLFTDIVDSTATAAVLGDAKWRTLIDEHDRAAKAIVARYRGEFVHTTGDGLLATFDGPARAIRCAQSIIEAGRPLGVEIRAGLHTGEIERAEHGVAGVGVHIGARVGRSLAGRRGLGLAPP